MYSAHLYKWAVFYYRREDSMKIAIGMCGKTSGKCSAMGCFRAYNNKDKYFKVYKDVDTELISFFSCNLCFEDGERKLRNIAERLKKNQAEVLHLGICAVRCREGRLEEIKEIFADLDIVEGTH